MTVQQEAWNLIREMPDESVKFIIELIHNMTPAFRTGMKADGTDTTQAKQFDVSKRFGAGIGIITDPEQFEQWDKEIAELFEGGHL